MYGAVESVCWNHAARPSNIFCHAWSDRLLRGKRAFLGVVRERQAASGKRQTDSLASSGKARRALKRSFQIQTADRRQESDRTLGRAQQSASPCHNPPSIFACILHRQHILARTHIATPPSVRPPHEPSAKQSLTRNLHATLHPPPSTARTVCEDETSPAPQREGAGATSSPDRTCCTALHCTESLLSPLEARPWI